MLFIQGSEKEVESWSVLWVLKSHTGVLRPCSSNWLIGRKIT